METEQLEQQVHERQLQTGQRLMYIALGSATAILFHVVNPLRDLIILFTLLYTTWSGFYLLWGKPWRNLPLTEERSKTIFGYLFASWLVTSAIFFYSLLPPLGLLLFAYTVFLLVMYWRTRKRLSMSDEMFP
jgi:hypothetical protein